MKLNDALATIKGQNQTGSAKVHFLVCGCQPLHLATFLHAYLLQRFPDNRIEILTGLYGDFFGNLSKAAESAATATAVIFEWNDLDPRLGLRSSGGWSKQSQQDILVTCRERFSRLVTAVQPLASRMPVVIAKPGLPIPPIGHTTRTQASWFELQLEEQLTSVLVQLSDISGVRIIQHSQLQELNAGVSALDAKMELVAGFPYTVPYASIVARTWVEVLYPLPPKKGLITDLDDTLWSGIVGEVGIEGISWDQQHHAQLHGLYQQMLGNLADCGVLIGACSKNELTVVQAALKRKDLFLNSENLFPVCAGWGEKSKSVSEILRAWNIGAQDVVFVDDDPMELSEVQRSFPETTCLLFPKNDPGKLWNLLGELRDLFGKPAITAEDQLRRSSLRAATQIRLNEHQADSSEFLRTLHGIVTFDYRKNSSDSRPLELINKTNQFNLNGRRMTEGEWRAALDERDSFVVVVSYEDKFGPLGRIATLIGARSGPSAFITHWVMSCRAFSRRLEYHTLECLFRHLDVEEVEFRFQATDRNQPLQDFFQHFGVHLNGSPTCRILRSQFLSRAELLPHQCHILNENH